MKPLSRRDFLKLTGFGLLGWSLQGRPLAALIPDLASIAYQDGLEAQQGRVTARLIWIYDGPSFNAARLKLHWRDSVVPISGISISQDPGDYNRVWYAIGEEGYAYSGTLQPVRTVLNAPGTVISPSGVLGEVTVPYTDAHEQPDADSHSAYRLYYDTVHWIMSAVTGSHDGKIWYQVLDDKWRRLFYVPAEHLRLIPDEELAPLSPDVPESRKKIQVRLADQLVLAYEDAQPVFAARAATGAAFLLGTYTTPTGHFMTYHKRPTRHMANGDITASGYDLPGVPWVMYFTRAGLSLHGTYWHNDFGHPKSHGCVNLSVAAAKWLFRWTNPSVKPNEQFAYQPTGTALEIVK